MPSYNGWVTLLRDLRFESELSSARLKLGPKGVSLPTFVVLNDDVFKGFYKAYF